MTYQVHVPKEVATSALNSVYQAFAEIDETHRRGDLLNALSDMHPMTPGSYSMRRFFERRCCHLTWIFRGFTRSAFGRVSVSTPSFISAVILCSSMLLGERLKLRR